MVTGVKNKWALAAVAGTAASVAVIGVIVVARHYRKLPYSGTYVVELLEGRALAGNSTMRLTFLNDEIDIYAGCNHMSGTYFVADNKLFWSEKYSTEVGCMPALAEQDSWLSSWLNRGVHVFRNGKQIVFSGSGVRMVLVPDPDEAE